MTFLKSHEDPAKKGPSQAHDEPPADLDPVMRDNGQHQDVNDNPDLRPCHDFNRVKTDIIRSSRSPAFACARPAARPARATLKPLFQTS